MTEQLKVTFTTIEVRNNGEGIGKGEIYSELVVDDQQVYSRPVSNPLKVADGETIAVMQSRPVNKEVGQTLTVEGSVSEKDDLSKDEFAKFTDTYTGPMNWGLGTHKRSLRDGKLDVIVTYKIERQ